MAKSRSIGGIFAELTLKDTKFGKGLKSASAAIGRFGMAAAKTGAVATASMTAALVAGTKKTITYGAELDHMSTQTGVAVSALMKIGQAYKDNGKSADTAGKDINKMQRAIYEASQDPGGSMDYFAELGLSAEKLMLMSPEEQFFAIGEALLKVQNQTKQTAVAMNIFGRSGAEVLKVFKGSTLDDVNASLGKMPAIMDQFSGAMERVDTLMGRLPNKSDQFFTGFTAGIVGQLLPGLESVNSKDFTDLGKSLGDAVAEGLQLIFDGSIWELFLLQGEKALLKLKGSDAIDGLSAELTGMMADPADVLKNSLNVGSMLVGGPAVFDDVNLKEYQKAKDQSYNYFKKLDQAAIDAKQEEIDQLLKSNRERAREKSESASLIGADVYGPELPPVAVASAISQALAGAPESRAWESSSYQINDMQRRGLGMGGEYVTKEGKEQVTLLQSINAILKKASQTGGALVWD